MKFAIIEHVIRTRSMYQELKSLLNLGLAAHEESLSPNYNEDDLFHFHDANSAEKLKRRMDDARPDEGCDFLAAQQEFDRLNKELTKASDELNAAKLQRRAPNPNRKRTPKPTSRRPVRDSIKPRSWQTRHLPR